MSAREPGAEREATSEPGAGAEGEEPEPKRPVRWGDRVKPRDVLVHPRAGGAEEKGADTQPVPVVRDDDPEDPRHGSEAADTGERDALEDTAPHPIVEENVVPPHSEAPSGRVRSTPLPPDD